MVQICIKSLNLSWDSWPLCFCPFIFWYFKIPLMPIHCSNFQRATHSLLCRSNTTFPVSLAPIAPAEVNLLYTHANFAPLYHVISFSHLSNTFLFHWKASPIKTHTMSYLFPYSLKTSIQGPSEPCFQLR